MSAKLRPYWLHAYLLTYTPLLLLADARSRTLEQQWLLGALTFGVLYLCARGLPARERRQVWLCVLVATGFEVFGSLVWGVYRYRLHNLPLFVPPGHGLVYLFGLSAVRTPLMRNHARGAAWVVLALASGWAAAGLTVLPSLTGRVDVLGALCLPSCGWFLLRSPRFPVFAAIFIATAELEIFGTGFGNWLWLASAPWIHVPAGNPPSVIAGGYCVIDGSVLVVSGALSRVAGRLRPPSFPAPRAVPAVAADSSGKGA